MRIALVATLAILLIAPRAQALDKQGSAHGGDVTVDTSGVNISGAASVGVALYNPSYAARPNNTGIALMRYALHADLDLIGQLLSVPVDINLFSDRQARGGLRKFAPSEIDVITGITTTHKVGPGALEMGVRYELDAPLDDGGYTQPPVTRSSTQKYIDARARYLYSLAAIAPALGDALDEGDVSGWLTAGWFAINPSYYARPDNSGLALFRYALHSELSVWHDHISVGTDFTFFTDRRESNVIAPSELDWTIEAIGRVSRYELHVAYERDMPVDRGGYIQHFAYLLAVVGFDYKEDVPKPLEHRGTIPSP